MGNLFKYFVSDTTLIFKAIRETLDSIFDSDMEVMSDEARTIFSNEADKKKYIDAVEKLKKNPDQPQKIILSTKEEITMVS
jgi:lipase chaperone LimK